MKKGISVQLFMALATVCISLLLGIVMAWQNYRSVEKIMLAATAEAVQQLSRTLDERRRRLIEPPLNVVQLMAYNPVMQASSLPQRLERLPQFVESLKINDMLSAIYVGYPNGEFVLVRKLPGPAVRAHFSAPSGSEFLVQSMTLKPDGTFDGAWRFYDHALDLIQAQAKPDYQFDPRSRPWFTQATAQAAPVVINPYVFYTTGQVGFTLAQRGAQGGAVIGMDVAIDDLNQQLNDLLITESAEVAVINRDGTVIASPNLPRQPPLHNTDEVRLPHIQSLDSVGVVTVFQAPPRGSEPKLYPIAGRKWYGMQASMLTFDGNISRVVVAVPADELLRDARQEFIRELIGVGLVSLLLLMAGWMLSRRISRPLRVLADQVRARADFDFSSQLGVSSSLTEIRELNLVLGRMSRTIDDFQAIALALNHGTQLDQMLQAVLEKLIDAFEVKGGAVYLAQDDTAVFQLSASADTSGSGTYPAQLMPGTRHPQALAAELDDPGQYLCIPMKDHKSALLGVLVLQLTPEQRNADQASLAFTRFVHALSGAAAVAIETRQLIDAQQHLLDAIIQLLANAIDAKSPYTGGHCERVPLLAESLIHQVIHADQGPYADFSMSDTELYEFRVAAWMHDCGKIASPESVMDKATKLETQYNRIHEIRTRFEVLWRDAEIAYWQGMANGGDPQALRHTRERQQAQLRDEFAFVANANIGGENMKQADIERLKKIGARRWWRHFDNQLGLARHEAARFDSSAQALPVQEYLLADRPDHVVPWTDRKPPVGKNDPDNRWGFDMDAPANAYNYGELYNLSIPRGTLTPEERFKINEHIVQTIVMLTKLPLPPQLKRVPDIAGTHHEKMDGTGYPRRLNKDDLGIPERVMMIADIFEALTAADRPYKTPKTLSESMAILTHMACTGHIDPDLFRLFLTSGVYRAYSEQFLCPSQLDDVDVQGLLDLISAHEGAGR